MPYQFIVGSISLSSVWETTPSEKTSHLRCEEAQTKSPQKEIKDIVQTPESVSLQVWKPWPHLLRAGNLNPSCLQTECKGTKTTLTKNGKGTPHLKVPRCCFVCKTRNSEYLNSKKAVSQTETIFSIDLCVVVVRIECFQSVSLYSLSIHLSGFKRCSGCPCWWGIIFLP